MRFIFLFSFIFGISALAFEVPHLTGHVTDEAGILSPQTLASLERKLSEFEAQTSNQIVVVTVSSLKGDTVEKAALDIFNKVGIGEKDKDNGVLLLISPNDRKLRIEVGYGLEGELPDVKANRIIRNEITPWFKKKNYNEGIVRGVEAILKTLKGGETLSVADKVEDILLKSVILGLVFLVLGLFAFISVLLPGAGWIYYLFLIPFWAVFPAIMLPHAVSKVLFLSYLVGLPVLKIMLSRLPSYKKAVEHAKTTGTFKFMGISVGSRGGSGRRGGFSRRGGGFSGRGGRSGGGGSSGSW